MADEVLIVEKYVIFGGMNSCNGTKIGKIKRVFFTKFIYNEDSAHHDNLPLCDQGDFLMKCIEENRVHISEIWMDDDEEASSE